MDSKEIMDEADTKNATENTEIADNIGDVENAAESAVDNDLTGANINDDLNDYVPSNAQTENNEQLETIFLTSEEKSDQIQPEKVELKEKELSTTQEDSISNEKNDSQYEEKDANITEKLESVIDIHDMESIDSEQGSVLIHNMEEKGETSPELSESPKTPKWFDFETTNQDFDKTVDSIMSPPNLNLAYHRYQDNEEELKQKSSNDRNDVRQSRDNLKKTFDEIKTGVTVTQNDALLNDIDWEFWSEVFNDYSNIVKNKQDELKKNITIGIPKEIRGMVWQIISDSNSMKLKEYFINTKNIKSDFEKLIRRDLARTSFIKYSDVKEKIDDLFNIIKTYSLYDNEVGYTQGMAFITVPLLMNMESDEAFCLLVRLMFTYGFREFYLPEMPGLHLRIYQFDRLIEDMLPDLHLHLKNQKIKSSMYALQWFLTLFAYKFPLGMVLRIFDVVIAEGLESILKFAMNLMIKNKDHLLTLEFDDLLNFLKEKLFYYYSNVPELPNDNKSTEINHNSTYQVDKFINDSMEIDILPITLNKYSAEFDEIDRIEKSREQQVKELQSKNGQLTKEIRKIEALYAVLNKDHVEIANEMVSGKLKIGTLEEENKLLNEQISDLQERLNNLRNTSGNSNIDFTSESKLSEGLDKEVQNAMEINLQVMDQNRILEDQLVQAEEENQRLKAAKPHIASMFGGLKKPSKFW
jgi:hypothetical protein